MTKHHYGKDLSAGSIPGNMIRFATPVFLANLISSGYAIVNTIWVGHILGGIAVAAVAVTFPIFFLMIALASSASMATSVLVAQNFGANRHDAVQKVIDTSWGFGAILIVVFTALMLPGAGWLLDIMGTRPEVHAASIGYLRLTLAQFAFIYLGFLLSSVLRAVGNSKIPLLFFALGIAINALLDPLLIIGVGPFPRLGLIGTAIASIIANVISMIAGLIYLFRHYAHSPLVPRKVIVAPAIVNQIVKIGLPTFIQHVLISVALGFLITFVNRFGANATAGFGIVGRIESLVILPGIAVMTAVSTMVAQAMGAGRSHRIGEMYRWGIVINTPMIALMSVLSLVVPALLMRLFVRDEAIVAVGVHYLRIVGWAYLFLIPLYVTNGVLIGARKTMAILLISVVSLCGFRIPLAALLSQTRFGLGGIWGAVFMSFGVNAVIGYIYYRSGKWQVSAVETGATAVDTERPETEPAAG